MQKSIHFLTPLSYLFTAAMRELDFVLIAKIAKMKAIRFTSQGFFTLRYVHYMYVQNVYDFICQIHEIEIIKLGTALHLSNGLDIFQVLLLYTEHSETFF